jgi:hypothetical protein
MDSKTNVKGKKQFHGSADNDSLKTNNLIHSSYSSIILGVSFFLSSIAIFCSFLFLKVNNANNSSAIICVCVFSSLMLTFGFSLIVVGVCLAGRKKFENERIEELQKLS